MNPQAPTLYLFAGSNGAGKTTFARAYLTQLEPIPRFLNADEIARGLSPLAPQTLALRGCKIPLHEIQGCLESRKFFGLESTLSGTTYAKLLQQAKISGYRIEIQYLWISKEQPAFIASGQAACKVMAKELRAQHKRWKLPLLYRENGKIVASDP